MARRTLTAATTLLLLSVVASCSSENGTSERQSEAQVGKSEPAITKETDALVELIQEAGQGSATARLTLARKYTESGIAARVDALMWLILAGRGPFAVGQFGGDSSVSGNAAAMGRFLGEVEALEIRLRKEMSAEQVATAEKRAAEWLPPMVVKARDEAIKGDPVAQHDFGQMLQSPRIIGDPRPDEAAKWFRKSAEQGYAPGQYALSYHHEIEAMRDEFGPAKQKAHRTEAAAWLAKAIDQGYPTAQYAVGQRHADGSGLKNKQEACSWFFKASEQGEVLAYDQLADCYAAGTGMVRDDVEAYKWLLLRNPKERQGYIFHIDQKLKRLAQAMTPQQISEAEKRAAEWKPSGRWAAVMEKKFR